MSVQLTITSIVCAGVMHGSAIGGVRRRGGINTLRAPGAGVDVVGDAVGQGLEARAEVQALRRVGSGPRRE
eukprot:scaffold141668_cov142-Phaeocystis_antarctica.AAC.1